MAGQDAATLGATSGFRRQVALVVADERSFLWSLSGLQNLLFFAALHGLAETEARRRAGALLERVGLQRAADRRYAEYSRGMRQRLALARGLLGQPRVMLLDEPTLGLDPAGALELRRFLREDVIKADGRTAVVGSNDPAEVRALADRVIFLRQGRVRGEAPPAELDRPPGPVPPTARIPHMTASAPPRLSTLRWFARVLVACLRRDLAETSRYRLAFLTRLASLALAGLSLYFFARFVGAANNRHLQAYGGDYLSFGVVGLIAAQLQHVGVTALATRVRNAQLAGFLEAQLATPAPAWMVLGAAPVYVFLGALVRAVALVLGAWLVLELPLQPDPLTLAIGLPLAFLSFGGLGLLGAAATMVTRRTNPVTVLLTATSALLSGVIYPVSVLPAWLRRLADLLPLTHALEVGRRGLLAGASPSSSAGR